MLLFIEKEKESIVITTLQKHILLIILISADNLYPYVLTLLSTHICLWNY